MGNCSQADEFFCLFQVLLNKMRTPRESKVPGVTQGNEGERCVKDFCVLPQEFWNVSSVFSRTRVFSACGLFVSD